MATIKKSVGKNGKNTPEDTGIVQKLINDNLVKYPAEKKLTVDKKCGTKTINAIIFVQKNIVNLKKPDGVIDPGGLTIKTLTLALKKKKVENLTINYRKKARPELSDHTKDVLKLAMKFAEVKKIDISSTRRLIKDQVRIMYKQCLRSHKNKISMWTIRGYNYGVAGKAVDKVFFDNIDKQSETEIKKLMTDEVKAWLKKGIRTSKHVVDQSTYQSLNVLDIPYSSVTQDKRDEFEQGLISISDNVQNKAKYSVGKKKATLYPSNLVKKLIIEKKCWHLEIPQTVKKLPKL